MNPNKINIDKMQKLIDKLNYYTKLYDEGHPAISDKEWDDMYFQLQKWENFEGVYLEDVYFKFDKVNISGDRLNIDVVMHSGKNRIIRRVFEKLEYRVKALDRYYYAWLSKGNLGLGRCRELTVDEVKFLKSL